MNIDFSNLTKEQKQYLFLGVLGVAAVGYGLFFGISKVGGSLSDAKSELEALNTKIDRAERELGHRPKALRDFDQTITVLESHLENLPPEENYYSWATEIIYSRGRSAGLLIESVDEVGMDSSAVEKMKDPVYFETYSLRIVAQGSYTATKAFISDIEKNHPLVRFTGIDISRGRDPEKHAVQLSVQWPHRLQRIAALWKDRRRESTPAVNVAQAPRPEPTPDSPAKTVEQTEAKAERAVAANPEPDYTPPAPAVAQAAPKPAPAPVPEKVEPEVVKPAPKEVAAPAVAQAAPKPAPVPAPEKVEPEVVKPAPKEVAAPAVVRAAPKPAPAPAPEKVEPEVVKPAPKEVAAPAVARAAPKPAPVPAPEKVEPEVVKPAPKEVAAPAVAQAAPKPAPAPAPEKVEPEVVKPAPKEVAAPVSLPEAEKDEKDMADLLASIDRTESSEAGEQSKEKAAVDDQMGSLLASLASHGAADSEEVPVAVDPVSVSSAQDLQNYVNELAVQPETVEGEEDAQQENVVTELPEADDADLPVVYVSSGKSAKILEDLLMKDKPKASKTLGSFLDGIVGDINESR
ncbi:hypothetical protein EGM51_17940 [Verrucomicrobia bacterium S94]|nr:hypothetical protein EGM51_17940 [Verrucomicrobia bacterium S94]